ncbi:M14 family zinc carboxypeptidase, partial [Escherichia coli]|nr:M14 family zinc carboxypeptidase [Escherichia coli]
MSLLTFGEPEEGKKKIWMIARQHPGETMAEWFMEGMIQRLLDENDTVARALLEKAVLYVVPNMNPDGGIRGHLRTNA